jgi:hypothetical protein
MKPGGFKLWVPTEFSLYSPTARDQAAVVHAVAHGVAFQREGGEGGAHAEVVCSVRIRHLVVGLALTPGGCQIGYITRTIPAVIN